MRRRGYGRRMSPWRRRPAQLSAHATLSAGDDQLADLLGGSLGLPAVAELLASRAGQPESRAHAVHAIGLHPGLPEVLEQADPDDATTRLLRAVRMHDDAWTARGRAVTSLTVEGQLVDFEGLLERAEEELDVLTLEIPEDEVPLWYLVSCSRGLGRPLETTLARLERLRTVAPTHRRGHSHALRHLTPKWGGGEELALRFAWQCSEGHPAGSVLHGLPPEALVEIWTSRLAASAAPDAEGARRMWDAETVRNQLDLSWAAYSRCEDLDAPWRVRDLNTFLFALSSAGMGDQARSVGDALAGRVSDYPWRYVADGDVTEPFQRTLRGLR